MIPLLSPDDATVIITSSTNLPVNRWEMASEAELRLIRSGLALSRL